MELLKKTYHEGNRMMDLQFSVTRPSSPSTLRSSTITIAGGMIGCKFQVEVFLSSFNNSSPNTWAISERFERVDSCNFIHYQLTSICFFGTNKEPIARNNNENTPKSTKMSEDSITLNGTSVCHRKGTIQGDNNCSKFYINFLIAIEDIVLNISLFKSLHDDTTLTDFELCAVDGSIDTHKVVLAGSSPVLKTMLTGEWKETDKGKLELAGVTKDTLIDLKNYIYLRELPDDHTDESDDGEGENDNNEDEAKNDQTYTRLVALLKLAAYLMMSDLVQVCTAHLLLRLTTENAWDLMHLAGTYKLNGLMRGILASSRYDTCVLINYLESPDDWM